MLRTPSISKQYGVGPSWVRGAPSTRVIPSSRSSEPLLGADLPRVNLVDADVVPAGSGLGAWLGRIFSRRPKPVTAVILGAASLPGLAHATVTVAPDDPNSSPVGICHPAFGAANATLAIDSLPRDVQSIARWLDETSGNSDDQVSARELSGYVDQSLSESDRATGPIARLLRAFADSFTSSSAANTTTAPNSRALSLAREMTRAGGTTTTQDVELLVTEVARIPIIILERAKDAGISVVASRGSVIDHLGELRGENPRGWSPDADWDAVPGLYHPAGREVVIAIHTDKLGGRCVPPRSTGHGSDNLVLHEFGHALDYQKVFRSVHASAPDFELAYTSDRDRLTAAGETYPLQAGLAGREEAFAESFSRYFARDPAFASELPALFAYWQSFEATRLSR